MTTLPIIVGVDGSEGSKRALRWAADYGKVTGAPVEALVFWEYPTTYGMPALYDDVDFDKRTRETLAESVREVVGDSCTVRQEVRRGHPATGLVTASEHAQLLVIGSRGHEGFFGLLLGSVSHHCVHHAHCPVLVMRSAQD